MHLSLQRASKVRLRVDAARKLSVLSRRLPPLGQASTLRSRVKSCNVGFARHLPCLQGYCLIAVVCNPLHAPRKRDLRLLSASLETSHHL